MESEGFVSACLADAVPAGRALAVDLEGIRAAVFRDGDTFHVLGALCPHANGPLDRGWIEEGEVVCPLHRWRFRLTTGRCTTIRGASVHRFDHRVRNGWIWVRVPGR